MLEQSTLHGRIFYSKFMGKTLVSKPVLLSAIAFGPIRPVEIYRVSDYDMWVQDKRRGDWYHYKSPMRNADLALVKKYPEAEIRIKDYTKGKGQFYYYGCALYTAKTQGEPEVHSYFIQNEPPVTYDGIPDIECMQMPLTMQSLDYGMVFHYPKAVKQLLSKLPACYVDRYKRPIKRIQNRIYPIAMEQVDTTWDQLEDTTYPIVLNFALSEYGIADLEPEHTKEDLSHFDQLPGFYEEDTPRGGKHKIVRIKDATFKFRYSKGLEIINQSQVTLYGIHAKWLSDNPDYLDTSIYTVVGHQSHKVTTLLERPDVSAEVNMLKKKAEENMSVARDIASRIHSMDPDDSHADWSVLNILYQQDVKPYASQLDTDRLPWILEAYASDIIPHRDKHETLRVGLPYLVFVANILIGQR